VYRGAQHRPRYYEVHFGGGDVVVHSPTTLTRKCRLEPLGAQPPPTVQLPTPRTATALLASQQAALLLEAEGTTPALVRSERKSLIPSEQSQPAPAASLSSLSQTDHLADSSQHAAQVAWSLTTTLVGPRVDATVVRPLLAALS